MWCKSNFWTEKKIRKFWLEFFSNFKVGQNVRILRKAGLQGNAGIIETIEGPDEIWVIIEGFGSRGKSVSLKYASHELEPWREED